MPVILSHNSALERLRAVPPQADHARRFGGEVVLDTDGTAARAARSISLSDAGLLTSPIHVLIAPQARRSESNRVITHSMKLESIPPNLLLHIGEGLYSASSELCFLEMARSLSIIEAIVLGYELCGSYSHFAPHVSGFYDRAPLTSKESISAALDALKGSYGMATARRALKWVLDGSASPMETVCSCMLSFPNEVGGEGFVLPKLNHEVALDEAGRRITGKRTCRIDMAWPDQLVGIEYNGVDSHTDEKGDRIRREALQHQGWTIFVFEKGQLFSYRDYSDLLGLLEGRIPRRSGMSRPKGKLSRQLLNSLLKATRCFCGYESALFAPGTPKGCVRLHL